MTTASEPGNPAPPALVRARFEVSPKLLLPEPEMPVDEPDVPDEPDLVS